MNKEQEQYYRNMTDMFETDGWKQLMEEIRDDIKVLDNVQYLNTIEELCACKAKIGVLQSILGLEAHVEFIQVQDKEEENHD